MGDVWVSTVRSLRAPFPSVRKSAGIPPLPFTPRWKATEQRLP